MHELHVPRCTSGDYPFGLAIQYTAILAGSTHATDTVSSNFSAYMAFGRGMWLCHSRDDTYDRSSTGASCGRLLPADDLTTAAAGPADNEAFCASVEAGHQLYGNEILSQATQWATTLTAAPVQLITVGYILSAVSTCIL